MTQVLSLNDDFKLQPGWAILPTRINNDSNVKLCPQFPTLCACNLTAIALCRWSLVNPAKCNYLTIPLGLSFFLNGSGTPIRVSKLVKDLGVQTDVSSPTGQCTEAANKARQLIFILWRSFQVLSKSAFIPLNGPLCVRTSKTVCQSVRQTSWQISTI